MRPAALRAACARVGALRACLLLGFLILAARAAHLTVVDAERGAGHARKQVNTTLQLPPARGLIVDREGVEMAVSIRAPSIYVQPAALEDPEAAARALARSLALDHRELSQRLQGRKRFTFVARWVEPDLARAVQALGLRGVGIVQEARRAYPGGSLAAHVLGFADIDGQGVRGIEQQEDDWLRGHGRRVGVERDGSGRLLAESPMELGDVAGGDVALTLDARMQAAAERALADVVAESGAHAGSVLSLDPRTGDVLSLAEWPSFDPNRFRELDYRRTRARAFLDAVEPGSTLKIFLVAAALDAATLGESELIDVSGGRLHVPGKWITDSRDFGQLDPTGVLRVSSNVGAVQIAQRLGPEAHHDALRRFGFGSITGSGFPVESAGLLRPWRKWKPLDHATIAFGQGIGVTSMQLASATAALANDGVWIEPRLVRARRRPGGNWEPSAAGKAHPVVRPESARSVLRMMEAVVSAEGTARRAGLRGVAVAGKTGTAQKLEASGGYSSERYIAWFVGAVPAENPKLVIVAAIDEPVHGAHHGGATAAPLFARVASAQLAHLGILTEPEPIAPAVLHAEALPTETPEPIEETPETIAMRTAGESATEAVPAAPGNPKPAATVEAEVVALAPAPAVEPPAAGPATGSGALSGARPERVLVPDLRGLPFHEVARIASENAIELVSDGEGESVEQMPGPGTILSGPERRVYVRFVAVLGGEG